MILVVFAVVIVKFLSDFVGDVVGGGAGGVDPVDDCVLVAVILDNVNDVRTRPSRSTVQDL